METCVQELLSFGVDTYAEYVLSPALKWSSCAIVQILLKTGAGFNRVERDLMVELFAVRYEEAQEHDPYLCEVSAKCESLVRTFPVIQERHGWVHVGRADCLPEAE